MFSKNLSGINNLTNVNNITATGDIETNTIELSPAIYLSGLTSNIQNQFNTISSNIIYNYNNQNNYLNSLSGAIIYNYNNQNNINSYYNTYINSLSGAIFNIPNIFKIGAIYDYPYGTSPSVSFLSSSGKIYFNFGLEQGAQGIQGNTGATGPKGDTGSSASAAASTSILGIGTAAGFVATGVGFGVLQSEIQGLATTVIQLTNSLATLSARVSAVINMVNDLTNKTKYLDCDRSGLGLAYLNSSINIGSNCVVGSNYTSQLLVNGKVKATSDVQIDGNLTVGGNITYNKNITIMAPPMIQF